MNDVKVKKSPRIIISIILLVTLILTGTYAAWDWFSEDKTIVSFTADPKFSCEADGGEHITTSNVNIMPAACYDNNHAIIREINVSTEFLNSNYSSVHADMWLDINIIDQAYTDSEHLKYALTTSKNSCTTEVITSGTFNGKVAGDRISLLNQKKFTSTASSGKYYLYIWLDEAETDPVTAGKRFDFSLGGECTDTFSPAGKMTLAEYVKYQYENSAKTTATVNGVTYNLATEPKLMNDRHGSMSTGIDDGDIRYYGTNPNNYVYFGCEEYPESEYYCDYWRIIGVFDGKVKIVKDYILETYPWSYTIDDDWDASWTNSAIIDILNVDYYNQLLSQNVVNEELISLTTWNVSRSGDYGYPDVMYYYHNRDSVAWEGNIGLVSPVDLMYSLDFSLNGDFEVTYGTWPVPSTTWIKGVIMNEYGGGWLLASYQGSEFDEPRGWPIDDDGYLNNYYGIHSSNYFGVTPVLYLNPNTKYVSGDGTYGNPYRINLD